MTTSRRPAPRHHSVLVIDDDPRMRDSLHESLERRGYDVRACADGEEGLACFEAESFDAILCDLRMPDIDGLEVCRRLAQLGCETPIVMITAHGSVQTAVEAMRHGAFDYITKPFKGDELQVVLQKAIEQVRLQRENRLLRDEVAGGGAIGESPAMIEVLRLVDLYAENPATVLIRGESGTGKEVIARQIHQRSPRAARAFVCVNCAALSAGLLESELFGHEKGAFTGAERRREGRFEIAEGGTLLLDEVSEIDPRLQAKLLRVLQEKTFERVGSSRSIRCDVRVLATSNRDLESAVEKGEFREDLFYRLNVLPIHLPPLRQRREDILLLAEHFLQKAWRRNGGPGKRLDREAERALLEYEWPGNVRELENVIERACLLARGPVIGPAALPGLGPRERNGPRANVARALGAPHSVASRSGTAEEELSGRPLREVERILIEDALRRNGGHQKRTASELGIGVRTLRSKIKKWGLGRSDREEVGAGVGARGGDLCDELSDGAGDRSS